MKLRTHHLVCFLMLLSASCMAEAQAMRGSEYTLGGRYISALLAQDAAENAAAQSATTFSPRTTDTLQLPSEARVAHTTAWTMMPPASHAATLQFTTAGL